MQRGGGGGGAAASGAVTAEWRVKLWVHDATYYKDAVDTVLVVNLDQMPGLQRDDIVEIFQSRGEPDDPEEHLLVQVKLTSASAQLRSAGGQLSLQRAVADTFRLQSRVEVVVRRTSPDAAAAVHIELLFGSQYISRADMWRLKRRLVGTCVYRGEKVSYLGMRATVQDIYRAAVGRSPPQPPPAPLPAEMAPPQLLQQQSARTPNGAYRSQQQAPPLAPLPPQPQRMVATDDDRRQQQPIHTAAAGYVTDDTRVVFRSSSAHIYILLQISQEMWHFDAQGDLHFERAIGALATELFDLWCERSCGHAVSVVLFARYVDAGDVYRVVAHNETRADWRTAVADMRRAFEVFSADRAHIVPAREGNVLEAMNLAMNAFCTHYIDRSFDRTGQGMIILSAGSGVFNVDGDLQAVTKRRVLNSGVRCELICLGAPPKYRVPLFSSGAAGRRRTTIPRWLQLSYIGVQRDSADAATQAFDDNTLYIDTEAVQRHWRVPADIDLSGAAADDGIVAATPQPDDPSEPCKLLPLWHRMMRDPRAVRHDDAVFAPVPAAVHDDGVNPFQPSRDVSSGGISGRLWRHATPPSPAETAGGVRLTDWSALATPACFPLTVSCLSHDTEELVSRYASASYTVVPVGGSRQPVQDLSLDSIRASSDVDAVMAEMMLQRLAQGFQLAAGDTAPDGRTVRLCMGHSMHQISLSDTGGRVDVRVWTKKRDQYDAQQRRSYSFRVQPQFGDARHQSVYFPGIETPDYPWADADQRVAEASTAIGADMKYWRTRLLLLPRHAAVSTVPAAAEEECAANFLRFLESMNRSRGGAPAPRTEAPGTEAPAYSVGIVTNGESRLGERRGGRPLVVWSPTPQARPATAGPTGATLGAQLSDIVAAMRDPVAGLVMYDRRWQQGIVRNCFVGSAFVDWLLGAFSDILRRADAVAVGQQLVNHRLIAHVADARSFVDGVVFYHLCGTLDDAADGASDSADHLPLWPSLSMAAVGGARLFSLSTSSMSLATASATTGLGGVAGVAAADFSLLGAAATLDVGSQGRSDRREYLRLLYDHLFTMHEAYHLEVNWIACTGCLVEDLVQLWARKAATCQFALVPVPIFATHQSYTTADPFRSALFVPLTASFVRPVIRRSKAAPDMMELAECALRLQEKSLPSFVDVLLAHFDFLLDMARDDAAADVVMCPDGRNGRIRMRYVHRSGVAFVEPVERDSEGVGSSAAAGNATGNGRDGARRMPRTPRTADEQSGAGGAVSATTTATATTTTTTITAADVAAATAPSSDPVGGAACIGFQWSINHLMTPRWRSAAGVDAAAAQQLLQLFRTTCASPALLEQLWREYLERERGGQRATDAVRPAASLGAASDGDAGGSSSSYTDVRTIVEELRLHGAAVEKPATSEPQAASPEQRDRTEPRSDAASDGARSSVVLGAATEDGRRRSGSGGQRGRFAVKELALSPQRPPSVEPSATPPMPADGAPSEPALRASTPSRPRHRWRYLDEWVRMLPGNANFVIFYTVMCEAPASSALP